MDSLQYLAPLVLLRLWVMERGQRLEGALTPAGSTAATWVVPGGGIGGLWNDLTAPAYHLTRRVQAGLSLKELLGRAFWQLKRLALDAAQSGP